MKSFGEASLVAFLLIVYFYCGLYFIGYMDHAMGLVK